MAKLNFIADHYLQFVVRFLSQDRNSKRDLKYLCVCFVVSHWLWVVGNYTHVLLIITSRKYLVVVNYVVISKLWEYREQHHIENGSFSYCFHIS